MLMVCSACGFVQPSHRRCLSCASVELEVLSDGFVDPRRLAGRNLPVLEVEEAPSLVVATGEADFGDDVGGNGGLANLAGSTVARGNRRSVLARRTPGQRCLRQPKKLFRGKYKGVTAFVGIPGAGKTYSLAEVGLRALHSTIVRWECNVCGATYVGEVPDGPHCVECGSEGGVARHVQREVWTNKGFRITCPGCGLRSNVFSSFEEFTAIPDGAVVCWDELPLFVNARKWQEFPDGLMYRLTQIRKDGLELYYSTIAWEMVDANVRRITFWVWECTARTLRKGHTAKRFPPQERRKRDIDKKPRQVRRVSPLPEVFASYNTLGKVDTSRFTTALGEGEGRPKDALAHPPQAGAVVTALDVLSTPAPRRRPSARRTRS